MRQGQQNRRGRGRNRKAHHNPLTRSYESNGPDVKIRGTPSHIAEKYMSLARDALSSGDPVLAENYLQHAEHYNRIIMAFREQNIQQSGEAMNGAGRHADSMEVDDYADDDGDEMDGFAPQPRAQEHQQRGGHHRFDDRPGRQSDQGRPGRDRYHDRGERGNYQDRQPQQARPAQQPQPIQQQPQPAEQPVVEPAPQPRSEAPSRRRDRFAASAHEQPEFLRRPVRRPRRDANGGAAATEANGAAVKDESGE